MQLKPDTETAIRQATPLFAKNTYTLRSGEKLAITSKMPHLMDHNTTGIVTLSQQFKNHDMFLLQPHLVQSIIMLLGIKSSIFRNCRIQYPLTPI